LNPIEIFACIPQKQAGFFRIRVPIPAGDFSALLVPKLRQIAESYGCGEFRCTPRHELEILYIRESDVPAVLSALDSLAVCIHADARQPNVVACPGADQCPVAYAKTKNLYFEIEAFLQKSKASSDLPPDFQIAISGCPNECSQVLINDVGFVGAIGTYGGHKLQGFEMTAGGSFRGEGRLATKIAFVSEEDVIPTLRDVLEIYRQQAERGTPFHDFFLETGPEEFSRLLMQQLKQRLWFFQI
jgi:dissimilatory sulfite reductase (desulfoviridin) alpha/beta subunit